MGKSDEGGYIVVETIGAFVPFVLLVISILSLVNIVTVQGRVHYALTQTANAISMYSYALDVTGTAYHIIKNDANAAAVGTDVDAVVGDVNQVLDGIQSLQSGGAVGQAVQNMAGGVNGIGHTLTDVAENPKKTVETVLNYAMNGAVDASFAGLVKPLVGHYLANGSMSGKEYLEASHVIGGLSGLDFYELPLGIDRTSTDYITITQRGATSDFLGGGDITLVVRYSIDYTFGALPLPFEPKLNIQQEVKTKAWLGGES